MHFERAHGVLVVSGDEDHGDVRADQFQDVESCQLGHLYIEKDQAGLVLGESLGGFETVGALCKNLNFRMGLEQFANDVPRELLIIHNERSYLLGECTQLSDAPDSAGSDRWTRKQSPSALTCIVASSP